MEAITTLAGLFILLLVVGYGLGAWDMLRSAIKPKPEDHLNWYDRVLRIVGALIFLAMLPLVLLMKRPPKSARAEIGH